MNYNKLKRYWRLILKPQEELKRVQDEKQAAFDTMQFPLQDSNPTDDEE